MGLFGKIFGTSEVKLDPAFVGLRQQVLHVRPDDIGLTPSVDQPIFGIVMETGMDRDVATFVCLADGTVSLYLSTGGGVIGGGQHESVRSAGAELLATTNEYAVDYIAAASPGLLEDIPRDGYVHFNFLTFNGPYSAVCEERALVEHADPFANLFGNCHIVLGEVREIADQR